MSRLQGEFGLPDMRLPRLNEVRILYEETAFDIQKRDHETVQNSPP